MAKDRNCPFPVTEARSWHRSLALQGTESGAGEYAHTQALVKPWHTHLCVHMTSEDPGGFKNLLHSCLSEPLASVPPGPALQGHQQSLVNDNPDVYAALGRSDRDQRDKQGERHLARSSQSSASSPHRANSSMVEWLSHFLAL